MSRNTVAKRRCLNEAVISPPSSISPEPSSSSPSLSSLAPPSPSSSPSPTYRVINTRPPPFHKWTKRGVGRYNADATDTDSDSTVMGYGSEGFESDASSSSRESDTGKRVRGDDSDDDEDADDGRSTTMALADFDAADLETPIYSTAQTPGTAIRMFNGVKLEGGSLASPASPASPARSVDLETPHKLSDYKGYRKAMYYISELATFEEDLDYVSGKSMLSFIDRMNKRACKSGQFEDEDFNSGSAFAAARAAAYPETESEDDCAARTRGDSTPKATTAARKYKRGSRNQGYKDGDSTPKAFGPDTVFYQQAAQDIDDLSHHNYDNNDDLHSGKDLSDEDSGAGWTYYDDSDQETVRLYGSGDDSDYNDYDHENYHGRYKTTDRTTDSRHTYEDEDGDHKDGYVDCEDDFDDTDAATDGSATSRTVIKSLV
ncbi:hypothetical protein BGZ47_001568 [Haplosporangium gracile]|nr:hypothetical protein BGZ47_001568 [Haplosporangium gracile]